MELLKKYDGYIYLNVRLRVEFKKNQRIKMTFWLQKCQIEHY